MNKCLARIRMNAEELLEVFDAAEAAGKYVWLKHRFDRRPLHQSFVMADDGTVLVGLYLSFLDDCEGLARIETEHVEWAHVSSQTTESVICERLDRAEQSETLVRLTFADRLAAVLFHHLLHASTPNGRITSGHFVQQETLHKAMCRSRVPLRVLLDVENTSIPVSAAKECDDFFTACDEPNLEHFREAAT